MKKYIQNLGYAFIKTADDLTHKQFVLVNASYSNGAAITFNNMVLDRVETYRLHLAEFDAELFGNKIVSALNSAISDGIDVSIGTAIEADRVENGYDITLQFNIRG